MNTFNFKTVKMSLLSFAILGLSACNHIQQTAKPDGSAVSSVQMETLNADLEYNEDKGYPTSTYEVFLYSFYDSDGDRIGDINGLIKQLDYINDGDPATSDDLGMQQLWLMPVMQSDSYHKYDVTDYRSIDQAYGTMDDFKKLADEVHRRGMRLIIDLVLNHSSDEHIWFRTAKQYLATLTEDQQPDSEACPYIDYYHFIKEPQPGFTKLDDSNWYYESRFSPDMPDLNLDHPLLQQEIKEITQFWFDLGTDGFRLDACAYYYTGNTEKNIAFLNWFHEMILTQNKDAYTVGETWENQDGYAKYYASGINSFFDFAFADRGGIIAQTVLGTYTALDYANATVKEEELYASYQPEYINAPFYTNHDMARSAGYYAGDDGAKTKIAGALNLLMKGNAFLYYGEELGMKGSGKDENKRAPMQWYQDGAAAGMCSGPKDMDPFKMKFASYEEQKEDPLSIYRYYRECMRIRNAFPQISMGKTEVLREVSDNEYAGIKKTLNESSVVIMMNITDHENIIDISSIAYRQLSAVLNTDTEHVVLKDGKLYMPAYSIAVLTE